MRSGIVHHKSDRKSCVLPTADRNSHGDVERCYWPRTSNGSAVTALTNRWTYRRQWFYTIDHWRWSKRPRSLMLVGGVQFKHCIPEFSLCFSTKSCVYALNMHEPFLLLDNVRTQCIHDSPLLLSELFPWYLIGSVSSRMTQILGEGVVGVLFKHCIPVFSLCLPIP